MLTLLFLKSKQKEMPCTTTVPFSVQLPPFRMGRVLQQFWRRWNAAHHWPLTPLSGTNDANAQLSRLSSRQKQKNTLVPH